MKISNSSNRQRSNIRRFITAFLVVVCLSCVYMKMDPPADVDKSPFPPAPNDNSCWQATASNMLAGAGFGSGNTLQARAEEIYGEMTANFGLPPHGWTDTALDWWLNSANNIWPNNPYTEVTVYGHKLPKHPWADPTGARFIGNELRRCQFVGLSISWPTDALNAAGVNMIGSGGHAFTAWGDEVTPALSCNCCYKSGSSGTLSENPSKVRVTDSDRETGGDVQSYSYDSYNNPNPGGPNEGNGWYIDYDPNHPYIKHIVTLCPIDIPGGCQTTQKVVGSYKIHQDNKIDATDLHYEVGTDIDILSYKTTVDWSTANTPDIMEGEPQRRKLKVDWDFSDKPVPYCTWVTITTEFVLPCWNAIEYDSVHFTYPEVDSITPVPDLDWEIQTPVLENADTILSVTGGYVIGAFDIISPEQRPGREVVGEYRLIHEYNYNQDPEDHIFILTGEQGYYATNFRFGHSYGYLSAGSLWKFDDWMTEIPGKRYPLAEKIELPLNWEGRLPYPEGEDIRGRIPEIKKR